jgi:hypothetical protein
MKREIQAKQFWVGILLPGRTDDRFRHHLSKSAVYLFRTDD